MNDTIVGIIHYFFNWAEKRWYMGIIAAFVLVTLIPIFFFLLCIEAMDGFDEPYIIKKTNDVNWEKEGF